MAAGLISMSVFNQDKEFKPVLEKIENGDIKTTHQLRLVLDVLAEKYKVSTLNMLVTFREWLLSNGIELTTDDGMVSIEWMED